MTEPAAPETPDAPVVDLDAGASFGVETLPLRRPFRLGGTDHTELRIRIPNGNDVLAYVDAAAGRRDGVGLIQSLCGITPAIWDALYAGDRGDLDRKVGRHIAAASKPRPPATAEIADLDAKQGFGTEAVALARPIKHRGVVYREIKFRLPNGLDVSRFVDALPFRNAVSIDLIGNLAELSADVFGALYAGDLAEVQAAVGKHL